MSTEEESPTNPLIPSTRCKVNDLCRLCLTSAEHRLEIFGKVGKMSNISEIISSLFNLQLMQHDNWPQSICIPCYQKLVEFQTFYSTVKATEATLIGLCGEWGPPDGLIEEGEEEKFSQSKEYVDRFEKQDEASSPEHSIDYPDYLVKVKEEEVEVSVDVLELDESVDELNNEEQDKTDDAEDEPSAAAATKKKPSKPKKKTKAATAKEKKSTKKNIPQVSQYVSERRKKYDREVTKYVKLTCDACE
uniref:ZAD domain-containing protein n=1 Tax=Lutzomyia longipalpis TaxID=7200 RepID=A0A1B0CE70_LUTLO